MERAVVPVWQTALAIGVVVGLLVGLALLNLWSQTRRRRGEEATSVSLDIQDGV